MAVQGSGQISIQDLVDEFGGSAPHNLTEYYRNGPYVGAGNTNVPISGAISLSDFYGAAASVTVTVTQGTLSQNTSTGYGYWATNKLMGIIGVPPFNTQAFQTSAARGSRTPTTLNGVTIQGIYEIIGTCTASNSFMVVLQGTRAKTFFTSVTPQGNALLTTASSNHRQLESSSIWMWDTTNIGVWDGAGNVTAIFE